MKKTLWITVGFLLFMLGFTALVLSLVGIQLAFLTWLDAPGSLIGFLLRILMIITGIIIVYLSTTNWKEQE